MAVLVIGIHTEPFGFNVWADRAFGILTRACVPFFFIATGYFFWIKEKKPFHYLKRMVILYLVWCLIYLPFDIQELSSMPFGRILYRYLWIGNGHALWFIYGSIIGFIITYALLKFLQPKIVAAIGLAVLIIGCCVTTWLPLMEKIAGQTIFQNRIEIRNGLTYAFPYISLGMLIAKGKKKGKVGNRNKLYIGLAVSAVLLVLESYVFVVRYKTPATILWLSVYPLAYCIFMLGNNTYLNLDVKTSKLMRNMSTLMYVSQYLFLPWLSTYLTTYTLFAVSTVLIALFSFAIIKLSELKPLSFLKYLY